MFSAVLLRLTWLIDSQVVLTKDLPRFKYKSERFLSRGFNILVDIRNTELLNKSGDLVDNRNFNSSQYFSKQTAKCIFRL